jgi:putative DNA primase/helicase
LSSRETSRQIEDLVQCADELIIFRNEGGQPFAVLPTVNGECTTHALRSARFHAWLNARFYSTHTCTPQPGVMRTAINILDMKAQRDFTYPDVSLRLGQGRPGIARDRRPTIALDLADPEFDRILEISAAGWDINTNSFFRFLRPLGTLSIPDPVPAPPAALAELRDLLRLSPDDWLRTLAWLLATFCPKGPYPILVLQGPTGSGKSLAAQILRTLLDPVAAPLSPLPQTGHAVTQASRTNRILAFDHVTTMNPAVCTALCQISSGIALYDPDSPCTDPILLRFARPVLLTTPADIGGNSWHPRPDLLDRTLTVTLPPLTPQTRRTESELWERFEQLRPRLLGALATAVSAAMTRRAEIHLDSYPRLADTTVWAMAACPETGVTPDQMRAALDAPTTFTIPQDPLPGAIRILMSARGHWQGTATQLVADLQLPIHANQIKYRLEEVQPILEPDNIKIDWSRKTEARLIFIDRQPPETSRHVVMPSSDPTQPPVPSTTPTNPTRSAAPQTSRHVVMPPRDPPAPTLRDSSSSASKVPT